MIHSHRPGEHIHIGLNFEFGMRGRWPWLTLIWCWYDLSTRETYGWRLRIRTHMRPFKLFSIHRQCVIDSFLADHDLVAIERSLLEDHAHHLDELMKFKAERKRQDRLNKIMSV